MNYIKKFSWLFVVCATFQQLYCSESQNLQNLEFPEHTTEKYIYNKSITTQDHNSLYSAIFGKHPNGVSVTDKTSEDLLSNRVTRKRVEIRTENGESIITTQTWVSRNPSYITWINGAMMVAAIAGITLGAVALNATGNIGAAGINATGNIGAAGINAMGNMGTGYLQAGGDIVNGALQSQNPEIQKAVTTVGKKLNEGIKNFKLPENISISVKTVED